MSLEINEYEQFEQEYGEYVTYKLNREQVLEGFYAAYQKEKPLEQLVLTEEPSEVEEDLFEYFTESSGWVDSVVGLLTSPLRDDEDEAEYADFADNFEIDEADENMLYWCRYDP